MKDPVGIILDRATALELIPPQHGGSHLYSSYHYGQPRMTNAEKAHRLYEDGRIKVEDGKIIHIPLWD